MGDTQDARGAVTTTPEAVAKRLNQALEYNGWKIADLRRRLEEASAKVKGYTALYEYIRGEKAPPLQFFEDAANALRVKLLWLAFDLGPMTDEIERLQEIANQSNEDLIRRLATDVGPHSTELSPEPIRALLVHALERKVEIETVARRTEREDATVEDGDIVQWFLELTEFVTDPSKGLPWDLADPLDMDHDQWISCALSRLNGIRQAMSESYRKARIEEAYQQRKEG